MNAFTAKPNIDKFRKEAINSAKKQKAGIIRAEQVKFLDSNAGDFIIKMNDKPKAVKQNAFTKKPDLKEFTRKLRASESSKASGVNRANQVSTCQPGGSLYPKVEKTKK